CVVVPAVGPVGPGPALTADRRAGGRATELSGRSRSGRAVTGRGGVCHLAMSNGAMGRRIRAWVTFLHHNLCGAKSERADFGRINVVRLVFCCVILARLGVCHRARLTTHVPNKLVTLGPTSAASPVRGRPPCRRTPREG